MASSPLPAPQYLTAGVNLTDFYAELTFITPAADPAGLWTFGFCFWADANGNCYDLFVSSNGANMNWGLGIWSPSGFDLAQSGPLPADAIDLTPGAENEVTVAVYKGIAMLSSQHLRARYVVCRSGTAVRWRHQGVRHLHLLD